MRATRPNSFISLLTLAALGGCHPSEDQQPVVVSVIGNAADFSDPLAHSRTSASRLLLGATAQGLVTLDEKDEVVPGLAKRWIVADEGRSYIFRLRRTTWIDGDRIDARTIAKLLDTRINAAAKEAPYGNMAAVEAVKAMTGEVIEIRLNTPRPYFLSMLAQPQLGLMPRKNGGSGPYAGQKFNRALLLRPRPAPDTGPDDPSPKAYRIVRSEPAPKAVARFALRYTDVVMGGTISDLPYVRSAPQIQASDLQFDPARGLFGLAVTGDSPFLQNTENRAALAMAIDRDRLVQEIAPGGWAPMTTLLPAQFNLNTPPTQPSWTAASMADRRQRARAIVREWSSGGDTPIITVSLGDGPGHRALFRFLRGEFAQIGIQTKLVPANGDLTLIDEVAPYDSGFWYLGRISCAKDVLCDPETEEMLKQATTIQSSTERGRQLSLIEARMSSFGGYIPLATPLRWALTGKRITNWVPSGRAWHPLEPLTLSRSAR